MAKTIIVAVRHGETEWNSHEKQQGQLDSPLTETGRLHACAMGFGLTRFNFDAFYTSDLGRAVETAEIIAKELNLHYEYDKQLRERNLGIMQGLTKKEFAEKYPKEYKHFQEHLPDYIIPEGESIRQRFERSVSCVEKIAEMNPGKTVLLVTHGGVLMSFIHKALNIPLSEKRRFSLNNGSINIFSIDEDGWRLESWGEMTHLDKFNLPCIDDN